MKFHDLAVGQRFEYDGAVYVKTSPVLAGRADGGGSRFMPRYVMVRLPDDAAPRTEVKQEKPLRAEAVLAAFEAYHAQCRQVLEWAVPAGRLEEAASNLERGRLAFLDAVSKG